MNDLEKRLSTLNKDTKRGLFDDFTILGVVVVLAVAALSRIFYLVLTQSTFSTIGNLIVISCPTIFLTVFVGGWAYFTYATYNYYKKSKKLISAIVTKDISVQEFLKESHEMEKYVSLYFTSRRNLITDWYFTKNYLFFCDQNKLIIELVDLRTITYVGYPVKYKGKLKLNYPLTITYKNFQGKESNLVLDHPEIGSWNSLNQEIEYSLKKLGYKPDIQ